MKKLQAKVNFSRLANGKLETEGQSIVVHMTGNEHFPELAADVALVQAAHVTYARALADAADGGKLARAKKDEAKAALSKALHDLGVKINLKAAGNEPVLVSTGYRLGTVGAGGRRYADRETGPDMKTDPLDKPGAIVFALFQGTGSVEAGIDPVDGAAAYLWQYTAYPEGEGSQWITVATTRNVFLFTGLSIGKQYCFKVAGIGYDPTPQFSDTAVSFAI